MSAVLVAILTKVAPGVIGPIVTWAVKLLLSKFDTKIPALAKIAISAAAGAVTAVTTGDVSSITAVAGDVALGGLMGAGGSKVRDVLTGNSEVATKAEKRACDSMPQMPWMEKSASE